MHMHFDGRLQDRARFSLHGVLLLNSVGWAEGMK